MALDKEDLRNVKEIVQEIVQTSENKIIATVSREITDLGEINRAVIDRVDKVAEFEKRLIRVEERLGIKA